MKQDKIILKYNFQETKTQKLTFGNLNEDKTIDVLWKQGMFLPNNSNLENTHQNLSNSIMTEIMDLKKPDSSNRGIRKQEIQKLLQIENTESPLYRKSIASLLYSYILKNWWIRLWLSMKIFRTKKLSFFFIQN